MEKKDFRIVFMGTPEFAVESLKALVEHGFNIAAVVTNPDKPAGRGQKLKESAVKKYAKNQNLHILQPESLKDPAFINELKELNPALQIVVAFKILPPEVYSIPTMGTFNLHASLLPDYRGAAPINYAIMNGEKKTGVTTFFLDKNVDTGKIIAQKEVPITDNDTAGSLHDKLMVTGSHLVVETAEQIKEQNFNLTDQNQLLNGRKPKKAPKIFKDDCRIDWSKTPKELHNFIRGLSPYPAAWSILTNKEQEYQVKLYITEPQMKDHSFEYGEIITDGKNYLQVACNGGIIQIKELQLAGKKRMEINEFLIGFRNINDYRFH
jgi:methionyl-tRNA formyltransferase